MADIELVIKIPQKWFDDMVREEFTDIDELCAVIQHGTPLPKCHGKIVDANRVLENGDNWEVETALMQTEAIIEANIESE